MHADRFRALLDRPGPFVSVYLDDSHDTADAAAQLDARLRDIRKHLEERSVEPDVIQAIDAAVRVKNPPVGRSGRGIIASGTAIVLDEHLIRPPTATVLRVSDLPYLIPVVEHGMLHTSYLVVAVDHTGADITVHDGGRRSESVDHKGDTTGSQGYTEEAVRKSIREVADRVTHLADGGVGLVFITGDARAELASALPERITAVQVDGGGRAAGTDETEVHRQIGQEFLKLRLAAMDDAAQRFNAGHGAGLAVAGLTGVTAALRDGSVDTLIIGELGDATVVDDGGERRADEALPMLAVATGASMVRTDERLDLADGIGAVLRYADPNVG